MIIRKDLAALIESLLLYGWWGSYSYVHNPNEHSFFLKETEPQEVFKIWRELNSKKPQMYTEYLQNLLKLQPVMYQKNIWQLLFNHSINQGIFSHKLKTGLIHPIHTGDSKFPFYPCLVKCLKNLCSYFLCSWL